MSGLVRTLFLFFAHLGGLGLLLLGILDSSFLFLPLGNDLLLIGLTSRHPSDLPYFILMAAAGSALGCGVTYWLSRKGGEKGLERMMARRQLDYVKKRVEKSAGWALAVSALMPPAFPFTPFVAAAAVFDFPKGKFFGILFGARLLRFIILGLLALHYGRHLIRMARSPAFTGFITVLVVVSLIGSVVSVCKLVQRGRTEVPASRL